MNQLLSLNILTSVIALLAIYIAYRQYKIAKYKVKFDLYEKRFKIYELCIELIDKIITNREVEDLFFTRFVRAKNESYFLFNKKVSKQVDDFYTVGFYYRTYKPTLDNSITIVEELDPQLIKLLSIDSTRTELDKVFLMSLFSQYGRKYFWDLNKFFSNYLDFKKLR